MQAFPVRCFFSLKKSKLPCTEYMDKCCKLITKACWDGNFCFMGHSRLDENKIPTLQSPALQNKLFWAHNLTMIRQTGQAACQASGELGSR